MRRINRLKLIDNAWGYLFIAPLLLYFSVFLLLPMFISLYVSFTEWNVLSEPKFVGLDNYIQLFTNKVLYPDFWPSLSVTFIYALITVPLGIISAVVVSAMLNSKVKAEGFFKTSFYIPSVTAGVAIASMWLFMLDPMYGLINQIFHTKISWLNEKAIALPVLAVMGVWSGLGYNTLIVLAAMKAISPSLYDAADIDGAGFFKKFIHITLPSIQPTLFFIITTGTIGAFQVFDQMYIMTGGGPNKATLTYMLSLYKQGFTYGKMGIASAMSYILFAVIMLITFISFKIIPQRRDV